MLLLLQVDIDTVEKFESLRETEKQYFLDMVKKCKDSGATLIICQWCCLPSSTIPHAFLCPQPCSFTSPHFSSSSSSGLRVSQQSILLPGAYPMSAC